MPITIRGSRAARVFLAPAVLVAITAAALAAQASPDSTRPFGTLRAQGERQQAWLRQRLDSILPGLMRKYGVDMWVVPMREYNEDPVFPAIVSPTTFAARRRTIYVFFDRGPGKGVERLALGGTSQGGLYEAVRSTKQVTAAVGGRQAELWGDQQWQVLKDVIETRKPKVIGIDISRTFAFADGLSAGEYEGMRQALGTKWTSRFRRAEGLPIDLIAARLPDEQRFYHDLAHLTWTVIDSMFSSQVVNPGTAVVPGTRRAASKTIGSSAVPSVTAQWNSSPSPLGSSSRSSWSRGRSPSPSIAATRVAARNVPRNSPRRFPRKNRTATPVNNMAMPSSSNMFRIRTPTNRLLSYAV